MNYSLGDLNNNQLASENYIEKYLPFKTQALIAENINFILEKKQRKRYQEFESIKQKELHRVIVKDNGLSHQVNYGSDYLKGSTNNVK